MHEGKGEGVMGEGFECFLQAGTRLLRAGHLLVDFTGRALVTEAVSILTPTEDSSKFLTTCRLSARVQGTRNHSRCFRRREFRIGGWLYR